MSLTPGSYPNTAPDVDNLEAETPETSPARPTEPFDPKRIEIVTKAITVDLLLSRLQHDELTLQPDFQRASVWNLSAKSRLIESMLIRLPLPLFYFDASDDEDWQTVDGLQRVTAIKEFVIDQSYSLQNLEFLSDLEGLTFDGLSRAFQRRISETLLQVSLIQSGTPEGVKFNLFKRINTGGMPLSAQEIRHALNQGPASELLKELAESPEFRAATAGGVRPARMGDRELVLRFLAFSRSGVDGYNTTDFDLFLHQEMEQLNREKDFKLLARRFLEAMNLSRDVLGEHAFRKVFSVDQDYRHPINKALFDAWSVGFANLTSEQKRLAPTKRDDIFRGYADLIADDEQFFAAISQGTGQPAKVTLRLTRVQEFLNGVLK